MKKSRFLISTLVAAGIAPTPPLQAQNSVGIEPAGGDPDGDEDEIVMRFAQEHAFHLAQHRSHSSHASHSSHRSGSSGTTRAPVYTPPPPRLPRATPTPSPSPSRNERSNPPTSILPSSPATAPNTLSSSPSAVAPSNSQIENVVRRVQIALGSYGYYVGAADGIMGPKTRSALREFQSDFGLKVTGTITPEVLDAFKITF